MGVLSSGSAVILKVGVPSYRNDVISQDWMTAFEVAHPGVTVEIVTNCSIYTLEQHVLEQTFDIDLEHARSADVLISSGFRVSAALMHTGYFLDLTSFVQNDSLAEDYYPVIWRSFQWNDGFWALPYGMNLVGLTYDPIAFNLLGLPHPDPAWTLEDLGDALRALTPALSPYQKHGKSFTASETYLWISLLGAPLVDASVVPNLPRLNTPVVAQFVEKWTAMDEQGLVDDGLVDHGAPISLGPIRADTTHDNKRAWSLLPGGRAGLEMGAILISAGTQNAELAYEFAKFLTSQKYEAQYPVRRSLMSDYDGLEVQTIERVLEVALPAADMRFSTCLWNVGTYRHVWKNSIEEALEKIQQDRKAAYFM